MSRPSVRCLLLATALWLLGAPAALAGDAAALDFNAWEHVPVFADGRVMPLDTFARHAASDICGRESPRLALGPALPGEDVSSAEYASARKLFPDERPRKFSTSELLLSWLVEPDAWERVPFLIAEHHTLREEILGVPLLDAGGRRLRYVSPYQCENSDGFWKWREEIHKKMRQAEAEGREFEFKGVDKKAAELSEAYNRWRQITFTPASLAHTNTRFFHKLTQVMETWKSFKESLDQFRDPDAKASPGKAIEQVETSLGGLLKVAHAGKLPFEKVEPLAAGLRFSAGELALWFRRQNEKCVATPPELEPERHKELLAWMNALASRANDLARQTADLHLAMFDNGGALRVVPALNPHALEEDRTPDENPQPWLSLRALLLGSDATLRHYPPEAVKDVKQTFAQVAAVYVQRDAPDRAERFAAATARFAAAVRELGEQIEPLREKLPVKKPDRNVFAKTVYPPVGGTDVEVHYNRFQPYLWSWIASLLAVVLLALSFGVIRKPMFWAGLAALVGAQLFILYGFGLRTCITRWAPVTNMFETVVFVALVVAGLGLWFTVLPLIWTGIKNAWGLTAAPMTWEVPPPDGGREKPLVRPQTQTAASWSLLVPRAYLMYWIFYWLTQVHYGEGQGYTAVSLLPRVAPGASPTVNDLITWAVGLCLLVPTVWYTPRAMLTALLGLGTVPHALYRRGVAKPLGRVLTRKPYAFAGAALALIASLLAFYAPVFDKDIGPLKPVLRDNFWLTIHVLSITASYGAGALALGLGNVALFHYLFGRYRDPALPPPEAVAKGHRPAGDYVAPPTALHRREPAACATLATFTYKAIQVAVLLLAAGTITGALWADVAWGRFWGWDAKEVWALISLLAYMVILHGRYAGLLGNFGLAAFSVVGALSILMAWYGVNYILDTGLHTYGKGTGGKGPVIAFALLDLAFIVAAAARYYVETHTTPEHLRTMPPYLAPDAPETQARAEAEIAAER